MTLNSPNGIHKLFGVFYKNELESVEMTYDDALRTATRLSQRDNSSPKELPISVFRTVKPLFVLETNLQDHFLFEVRSVLHEATKLLKKEQAAEAEMIAEATKNETSLPPNYWEPRYKAWLKVEAAKRIVLALESGQ